MGLGWMGKEVRTVLIVSASTQLSTNCVKMDDGDSVEKLVPSNPCPIVGTYPV